MEQSEVEDLKPAAATALERGFGFVEAHGDALALLRTRVMLAAQPLERCLDVIEGYQRPDGSFPELGLAAGGAAGFEAEAVEAMPGPVLGTLEALIMLSDLSALFAPCVERAAAFLQRVQLADGSWGRESGQPAERIFASGMVSGVLGRTRVVRPVVLEGAGRFLAGLWSPDRLENASWGVLAAFGSFFSNVAHDLSDGALQWVGRELERGYRSRRFDAVETLRLLLHCDAVAVPGATLEPLNLLQRLLGEQGRDGGFAELAPGGPRVRVTPTIDGMLAIMQLCRLL